jgi:hypothetical protein
MWGHRNVLWASQKVPPSKNSESIYHDDRKKGGMEDMGSWKIVDLVIIVLYKKNNPVGYMLPIL